MIRLVLVAVLCACAREPAQSAAGSSAGSAVAPADHQLHRTDAPGRVQIVGTGVPLATQPTLDWFGLPMSGDIDVAIDVQHLDEPSQATGTIRIACPAGCRLGDDKTKLKPATRNARTAAFASELTFGHINFDRVTIVVDIVHGKGTVTTFDVASKDVTLKLSGTFEVATSLADARVDLCVRFAGTPVLEARDPKTFAVVMMSGAPRASDGLLNIKLADRLGTVKRIGIVCDGSPPPDATSIAPIPEPAEPTSNDVEPDLARLIASAVKKTGASSYTIDRTSWDALLANPTAIARGARVVPAMTDGKAVGFKLFAIRPESLFAHLGLENGDTILSIAGLSIVSADKALEVYTKLRDLKSGEAITAVLERRSARVTLTYTLR